MKKTLSGILLSCVLLLAYFGMTDSNSTEDQSSAAPQETTVNKETETKEEDPVEIEAKSETKKEETVTAETYTGKFSAEDVVYHWRNAGLSAEKLRDNTDKQCGIGKMNCTQLITTEDVSIHIWPSVEEAKEVGTKYHDFAIENISIRFNEPMSPREDYIKSLQALVAE